MLHVRSVSSLPVLLVPLALVGVLLSLGGCASGGREAALSDARSDASPAAEAVPTLEERMAERDRLGHVLGRADDLLALVRTARLLDMPIEEADPPDWRAHQQEDLRELLALDARWRAATREGAPEGRLEAMLQRDVVVGRFVEKRLPEVEHLIARFEERLLQWERPTASAAR